MFNMTNQVKLRILFALLFLAGSAHAQNTFHELEGEWRGEFTIRDNTKAPFNFEISGDGKVYLLNADERFETGVLRRKEDSVFIPLDQFDNELALKINRNGQLSGYLRKQNKPGLQVPVTAKQGSSRFHQPSRSPIKDFSGKYEVQFTFASGNKEKCVAVFHQQGSKLTGTFLKPSGDARYLEGMVDGNHFYLSSFIGSTPGYYEGTITADGKISGVQLGTKVKNSFSGTFNPDAQLEDPFAVSHLKEGYSSLEFSLPDMEGNIVSTSDERFNNKVLIIAITGTWCPNCIDEAAFLSPWYKENKGRGVEVISIHYERQSDTAFTHKVMRRFQKRFDITYAQVFGGIANNDSVSRSLPALASFKVFPTTIFIGRKGNVSKIHAGFSGPAAGKFYDDFVKEFNEEVDRLLAE